MLTDPRQSVSLGGLDLMIDGDDVEYEDGYTLRITGEDATLGASAAVTSVLFSMLTNGSIVQRDRDDNRQPSFVIEVEAAYDDGRALALGEQALQAVCDRRVELVWTPPQTGAPVAVFDVVDSKLDPIYSDMDELNQVRGYRLAITALPYARSQGRTVFPALPTDVDTSITPIDTADATTGWTSAVSTITDVGTAVRIAKPEPTTPGDEGDFTHPYIQGFLALSPGELATLPYILVEYRAQSVALNGEVFPLSLDTVRAVEGGLGIGNKIFEEAIDTEWKRAWFYHSLPTATSIEFRIPDYRPESWLEIRDVSGAKAPPVTGSRKQLTAGFDIGGSVTTQGDIDLVGTAALGDVIVYTRPADGTPYRPPLSPYVASAALYGTTDAATVSGKRWDVTAAGGIIEYSMPAAMIPPGDYHIVVRVKNTTNSNAFPMFVSLTSMLGATVVQSASEYTVNVAAAPVNTWVLRSVGTYSLPPAPLGLLGVVRLLIGKLPSGNPDLQIDEVWLFKADGRLTIVNSVIHDHVRIVAPNLDNPSGAIWSSDDLELSTAYGCASQCASRQHHDLSPGSNQCFTVTTAVDDTEVSATAYNRWNTYPAD